MDADASSTRPPTNNAATESQTHALPEKKRKHSEAATADPLDLSHVKTIADLRDKVVRPLIEQVMSLQAEVKHLKSLAQ
jgi:hypothetical protein